jgi:hypothetical protein
MIASLRKMGRTDQERFMSNLHEAIGRKFFYKLNIWKGNNLLYVSEDTDRFDEYLRWFEFFIIKIISAEYMTIQEDDSFGNVFDFNDDMEIQNVKTTLMETDQDLENIFFHYLSPLGYQYKKEMYYITF